MISGDIDLTENLDFRKVVRKEIPQLPEKWSEEKSNKLNYEFSNNTYITTTTSSSQIIRYDTNDDGITWLSFRENRWSDSSHNIRYTYNISNNDYFTIYDNDDSYDVSITTSNNYIIRPSRNNITFKIENVKKESEYDILGNVIEPPEKIPKFPWDERIEKEYIPSIPWERYGFKYHIYEDEIIPSIPWEEDDIITTGRPRYTEYDRLRDAIPWLADKSSSFIDKYFNPDDEADLSYLTNMQWIRVRDAVID